MRYENRTQNPQNVTTDTERKTAHGRLAFYLEYQGGMAAFQLVKKVMI
jgi:hypothetical protein